jgi:hypothetical protein
MRVCIGELHEFILLRFEVTVTSKFKCTLESEDKSQLRCEWEWE